MYKPNVSRDREKIGWLSVSVMIRALIEEETVERAIRHIVLPLIRNRETGGRGPFLLALVDRALFGGDGQESVLADALRPMTIVRSSAWIGSAATRPKKSF
jgi:hypothetical protein